VQPAGVDDARKHEGRDDAACRDRGLAQADREAELVDGEPPHHRTPGGGVDRHAERRCNGYDGDEHRIRGDVRGADQRDAARPEPCEERCAFSEPVRSEPPCEDRHEDAEGDQCQERADLPERDVVLVPNRGGEHGQADDERRERSLRGPARREYRPAVPRARRCDHRRRPVCLTRLADSASSTTRLR
jgi:hypothetical protein